MNNPLDHKGTSTTPMSGCSSRWRKATAAASVMISSLLISGCASQQRAQEHWQWLSSNSGIRPGYTTGVTVQNYQINGQSYQVIAPAR